MGGYKKPRRQTERIRHDALSECVLFEVAISPGTPREHALWVAGLTIEPFVDMESSMGKILKGVRQDHCREELEGRNTNRVYDHGDSPFPTRVTSNRFVHSCTSRLRGVVQANTERFLDESDTEYSLATCRIRCDRAHSKAEDAHQGRHKTLNSTNSPHPSCYTV